MQKGQLFKGDYLRKCLRDVFGLGLFESMSVNSKPSKRDDTRVDIELMLKERPMKTADLDLEWQLAPTPSGRPGLVTLVPGVVPPPPPPPPAAHPVSRVEAGGSDERQEQLCHMNCPRQGDSRMPAAVQRGRLSQA